MSDDGFQYCPYCGKSFTDDSEIEVKSESADDGLTAPPENNGADGAKAPGTPPPFTNGGNGNGGGYGGNGAGTGRPDNVPQGRFGPYNGGGYGYYGYNNSGYTVPPPYVPPVRREKTPSQKFFSALGHAALYFLLFFLCQTIVTFGFIFVRAAGMYTDFFDEYMDEIPDNGYISDEEYDRIIGEMQDKITEDLTDLDFNLISLTSSVLTIVALAVTAALKHRPFSEHTGFYPLRTWKAALLFPLGVAVQFLVTMVVNLIPWSQEMLENFNSVYEYMGHSEGPVQFIVEIVAVGIMGPLVEELIFRGCIYTRLRRGMPTAAAVIISAAAFGMAHGVFIAFCYATVLGLMLAYTYVKFETVLAPFILHMGFNLANYIPLMREDSSPAEVIITLVVSAVVAVACASVIVLSDVSRKKAVSGTITVNVDGENNGGNNDIYPPQR